MQVFYVKFLLIRYQFEIQVKDSGIAFAGDIGVFVIFFIIPVNADIEIIRFAFQEFKQFGELFCRGSIKIIKFKLKNESVFIIWIVKIAFQPVEYRAVKSYWILR